MMEKDSVEKLKSEVRRGCMNKVQIIIMCKAPVQGQVKTRLMSQYSALEAMQWHQAMATTVIERAKRLFSKVIIAVDDVEHPFFASFDLPLLPQGSGNLGTRMIHIMQQLESEGGFLFLGTDSPHMQDERLRQAVEGLQTQDVVLGAVEDGGYDLIAMRQAYEGMLQGVDWGTEHVLQQSLALAHDAGLACKVLDVSFDVDTPDMLQRAIALGWRRRVTIQCADRAPSPS